MIRPLAKSHQASASLLSLYYETLLGHFGPQRWWPARTRLEVILGAILTQNTTWRNAELALRQLRKAGLLNLKRLRQASRGTLASLIRPAGFYRQKAATIRNFLDWLELRCGGSLRRLFALKPAEARQELLQVNGLGPETVDAILLYAGRQPFFVADAYTRRILARHGLVGNKAGYGEAQRYLHQNLPADPKLFNEFHALLVAAGKEFCWRKEPQCHLCTLRAFLPSSSPLGKPRGLRRAGRRRR